jgi:hypothetical protein
VRAHRCELSWGVEPVPGVMHQRLGACIITCHHHHHHYSLTHLQPHITCMCTSDRGASALWHQPSLPVSNRSLQEVRKLAFPSMLHVFSCILHAFLMQMCTWRRPVPPSYGRSGLSWGVESVPGGMHQRVGACTHPKRHQHITTTKTIITITTTTTTYACVPAD